MSYALTNHPKAYSLSGEEACLIFGSGFTNIPYARRHQELSNTDPANRLGHRVVAALESIPIVGGIASSMEYLATRCLQTPTRPNTPAPIEEEEEEPIPLYEEPAPKTITPWSARAISWESALPKMIKNTQKAAAEHFLLDPNAYIDPEDLVVLQAAGERAPLAVRGTAYANKGMRKTMEDAHIFLETNEYVLAGVFDGHGGGIVSRFAQAKVKKNFDLILKKVEGNVHQAFEKFIDALQKAVKKNKILDSQGTTLLLSFIDKKRSCIYTATVGDSEANLYRESPSGQMQSIPLSCLRNWTSPKDEARANVCIENSLTSSIEKIAPNNPKPYYCYRSGGMTLSINLSRTVGDVAISHIEQRGPALTHKPKITIIDCKPGDILILTCDGVKDFVPETNIIRLLEEASGNIAHRIGHHALTHAGSTDNITVCAIEII